LGPRTVNGYDSDGPGLDNVVATGGTLADHLTEQLNLTLADPAEPRQHGVRRARRAGRDDDAARGQHHRLERVGPIAAERAARDRLGPVQARRPAEDQHGRLERRLARPAAGEAGQTSQDRAAAGEEDRGGDVGDQVLRQRIGRPRRGARHHVVTEGDVLEAEADEGQREEQPTEALHRGHGGAVYAARERGRRRFDEPSAWAGRAWSRRRDPGRRSGPGKRLACDRMTPTPHAADA